MMIKKVLLAAATVATALSLATWARANIVLVTPGDIIGSFVDVGSQGFGNFHRALTLQHNDIEFGARGFGNAQQDEAIDGADKGNTPTVGALGWNSGLSVGIGFNSNQTGNSGITLDALRLVVWNTSGTIAFTAALAAPINFSQQILSLQQGNGNAVFDFGLDATERAEFNTMLALPGSANFTVGIGAVLGCGTIAGVSFTGTFNGAGCMGANDGADSFTVFSQAAAVPGPDVGTGIPGVIGAGLLLLWMARRRKQNELSVA